MVHSKAHSGKASRCTSFNRQYLPDQSTSLLVQNCANLVDAQTAFETAEAREQSSESAAANVAAAVWPDTIVRENTVARVERLAWLRSMAKSTQTSATSGEYFPYCADIYAVPAQRTEQTCLLVAVLCLLICMCMLVSKSNFANVFCGTGINMSAGWNSPACSCHSPTPFVLLSRTAETVKQEATSSLLQVRPVHATCGAACLQASLTDVFVYVIGDTS